jgi:dihydroorotate dehydrogenase
MQYNSRAFLQAELAECLERDGFKSISEAVGADYR